MRPIPFHPRPMTASFPGMPFFSKKKSKGKLIKIRSSFNIKKSGPFAKPGLLTITFVKLLISIEPSSLNL